MMKTAIGKIYWRKIKSEELFYESVPVSAKESVKAWANDDVSNGVINDEQYFRILGEKYVTEQETDTHDEVI